MKIKIEKRQPKEFWIIDNLPGIDKTLVADSHLHCVTLYLPTPELIELREELNKLELK